MADGRVHITFRAAPNAKDWIDEMAHEHRVDRSTLIRFALTVARRNEKELRALLKEQS